MIRLPLAALALLAFAAPAWAQLTQAVVDACWSDRTPAEERVRQCAQVTGSGLLAPKDLARAHIYSAVAYSQLKQHQRALEAFERAIALDPGNAMAFNGRGVIHRALVGPDRAIADYDRAIQLDPQFAAAYYNRGLAYRALNQPQRALADYERAIGLDPGDADFRYERGNAHRDVRQFEQAIADYDHAIRLDPNRPAFHTGRCWSRAILGQQLDLALADCNAALRLDANFAPAFDSRGMVHLKAGRYADAESDYATAARLLPESAHVLFGLGVARLRRGNAAGRADIAAARGLAAQIDDVYGNYGVKP